MTAVVIPEAPAIVGNDVTNVLVPSVGVDITKLEVSLDGGLTYSPFNIATTYLGNKTVLVRVMALDPHPAGKTTEVRFTNSAPAITSGSSVSASLSFGVAGTIPAMTVVDADGDTLVYSLAGAPAGVTINPATGVITIPGNLALNTYTFTRIASDGVLTASQSISLGILDTTPPVTSTSSVGFITDTAATFSVSMNETGTGYYLVLPANTAVPSVATIMTTGTPLAITANVVATPNLTGLTPSTAHNIYFVGKDAAGNVQTTATTLSFSTNATPDSIPDAFTFVDQTGVALSSTMTSASITVAGINVASPISVTGGEYSING